MSFVRIFLENRRAECYIIYTSFVACITAKSGSRVVIATIAQIIHLQGIASGEDAAPPVCTFPDVFLLRVTGQPEAVEIAQSVVGHLGIIFHNTVCGKWLSAP